MNHPALRTYTLSCGHTAWQYVGRRKQPITCRQSSYIDLRTWGSDNVFFPNIHTCLKLMRTCIRENECRARKNSKHRSLSGNIHAKACTRRTKLNNLLLYKAAEIFVCLSACLSVCTPPPFFSTRPSDRNQIWPTCSGRYGTHSELKKNGPAHPRGNITSYVTSSNVEYVRHLKTTARRSMTWYYVMLAFWLATSFGPLPPSLAPFLPRSLPSLPLSSPLPSLPPSPPSLPPSLHPSPPSPPSPPSSPPSLPPSPPSPPSPSSLLSISLPPSLPFSHPSLPSLRSPTLPPLLPSLPPSLPPLPSLPSLPPPSLPPLPPLPPSLPPNLPPFPSPPTPPPPLPPSLPPFPSSHPSSRAKPGDRLVSNITFPSYVCRCITASHDQMNHYCNSLCQMCQFFYQQICYLKPDLISKPCYFISMSLLLYILATKTIFSYSRMCMSYNKSYHIICLA